MLNHKVCVQQLARKSLCSLSPCISSHANRNRILCRIFQAENMMSRRCVSGPSNVSVETKKMNLVGAINDALRIALENDKEAVIFGEDVGSFLNPL